MEAVVRWQIHHADVLDWAESYDGPKFHAVLSDPPYGLAFMGRDWDSFSTNADYQAWVTDWATALLENALYPGAVCLFFGGTRTWHRLAVGLEDAGFRVCDSLMYLYGVGFPKSHDISKAIDRANGAEREVVGRYHHPEGGQRTAKPGNGIPQEGHSKLSEWHTPITAPATPDAARWDGYGTALKPAWEPVILCRKPRDGTYANTALSYGTSALWIDGARIGTNGRPHIQSKCEQSVNAFGHGLNGSKLVGTTTQGRWPANLLLTHLDGCERVGEKRVRSQSGGVVNGKDHGKVGGLYEGGFTDPKGKRKAIKDADGTETVADWRCVDGCPVRILAEQSGERSSGKASPSGHQRKGTLHDTSAGWGMRHSVNGGHLYGDTGTAARFFYTAKASRSERNAGLPDGMTNKHPTVKPLSITEYLARLILPPVLDEPRRILIPFSGSGSEMAGAGLAGWDEIIGVEMNAEAIEVAEYRLAHWLESARQGALL